MLTPTMPNSSASPTRQTRAEVAARRSRRRGRTRWRSPARSPPPRSRSGTPARPGRTSPRARSASPASRPTSTVGSKNVPPSAWRPAARRDAWRRCATRVGDVLLDLRDAPPRRSAGPARRRPRSRCRRAAPRPPPRSARRTRRGSRPGRGSGWRRRRSGRCCGTSRRSRPRRRASRSASSKTISGALPPSSSETFLTVPAHFAISCLPTSVEPVKVSLRTVGFVASSSPTTAAVPGTTLKTPGGQARALGELGQRERRERRRARRLQHHRAAGGERRARPCAGSSPSGSSTA